MATEEQRDQGQPVESQTVSITRYPNRRLYDRSQARYITLQELADLVRQGKDVAVRDSKTGEDLTRSILTQIILEHHPERMKLFPVGILNSMIRANETTLSFLRDYFLQSLGYLDALQRPSPFNPLSFPMAWMKTLLPPGPPANSPPESMPPGTTEAAALATRVAELERRLEELQSGSSRSEATPSSPGKAQRPAGRRRKGGT